MNARRSYVQPPAELLDVACQCGANVGTHLVGTGWFDGDPWYLGTVLPIHVIEIGNAGDLPIFGFPQRLRAGRGYRRGGADPWGGEGALRVYGGEWTKAALGRTGAHFTRIRRVVARAPFVTHCGACGRRVDVVAPADCRLTEDEPELARDESGGVDAWIREMGLERERTQRGKLHASELRGDRRD